MEQSLFFFDMGEDPRPREEVEVTHITATPYPDGSRVRVKIQMTPFEEKPNLEIIAQKTDGPIVAEMSVIETITPLLEFTMHIRGVEELIGSYTLRVELFYEDRKQPQHVLETPFEITETAEA